MAKTATVVRFEHSALQSYDRFVAAYKIAKLLVGDHDDDHDDDDGDNGTHEREEGERRRRRRRDRGRGGRFGGNVHSIAVWEHALPAVPAVALSDELRWKLMGARSGRRSFVDSDTDDDVEGGDDDSQMALDYLALVAKYVPGGRVVRISEFHKKLVDGPSVYPRNRKSGSESRWGGGGGGSNGGSDDGRSTNRRTVWLSLDRRSSLPRLLVGCHGQWAAFDPLGEKRTTTTATATADDDKAADTRDARAVGTFKSPAGVRQGRDALLALMVLAREMLIHGVKHEFVVYRGRHCEREVCATELRLGRILHA